MPDSVIRAVLFDLDDTLFEQRRWLAGAWRSVAVASGRYGVDTEAMVTALEEIAAAGTDRGMIIDRALSRMEPSECTAAELVAAFRAHRSVPLEPYPGVRDALTGLRARVPIGVVTDGDPVLQADKLQAVGLEELFDVIVFTDALGRELRKPHPAGYLAALDALGVEPAEAVVIGDRPSKDVAAAHAAGMRAIRVLTGEYREVADDPPAWRTASDCAAAVRIVEPMLAPQPGTCGDRPVQRSSALSPP